MSWECPLIFLLSGRGAAKGGDSETGSQAFEGPVCVCALLPALAPGLRPLTRRVSSGRRLEARAVPEVLGEVGGAGHADQGIGSLI